MAATEVRESIVVSGASPLADDFRSGCRTEEDYRRFHFRAVHYGTEITFCAEDFAELVEAEIKNEGAA